MSIYRIPLPNILYHTTSNKNFGVDIKLRFARRLGSLKNLGSHSKPKRIQN
jgi:hypothetical protein